MSYIIQLRRGNSGSWTSVDPTLAQGEIGLDLDLMEFKVGDGSTAWSALSYYKPSSAGDADKLGGQLPSHYATAADLTAHTSDMSNPHSVTAAQAGALALTGGTLTGALSVNTSVTPQISVDVGTAWFHVKVTSTGKTEMTTSGSAPDFSFVPGAGGNFNFVRGGYAIAYNGTQFRPYASNDNAIALGASNARWSALYVASMIALDGYQQYTEITDPGAGPANSARIYARDNGSGKTQLVVQFGTGTPIVLATEA